MSRGWTRRYPDGYGVLTDARPDDIHMPAVRVYMVSPATAAAAELPEMQ